MKGSVKGVMFGRRILICFSPFRKIIGVILILMVPIAVALPGLPGDIMLLTGIALLSPNFALWLKNKLAAHKKIIIIGSILWMITFWSYLYWRFIT